MSLYTGRTTKRPWELCLTHIRPCQLQCVPGLSQSAWFARILACKGFGEAWVRVPTEVSDAEAAQFLVRSGLQRACVCLLVCSWLACSTWFTLSLVST